ncbi:hypothetical protein AAVH_09579 [Aphelenchoides avenae]|nr:hypothetical protein AAVH_09579 [Aphelenchus avenae]
MDALDGHAMTRGPIRVAWTTASKPSGHVIRVLDLPAAADRKMLKKIFSRYEGLRRVEVDYDRSGRSNQMGYLTFANREQAHAVVEEFDGRFVHDDKGIIRISTDRLNRELERAAAAEAALFPAASSAFPITAIPDLLTGSVIHVTANAKHIGASTDLIDLSDPAPPPLPSPAISPVVVGYIYAEKRQYEIPIHFYAVPETEKLETATQILLGGFYAAEDVNNNKTDQRNTKVTLVARGMQELVAAMDRINAAAVDCWMSDDPSIRSGHAFHPSEWTTVNVSMAPICNKIKYSQHVVFLSPIDDPDDIGAAMDVIMLERTHVNLVSVLFDEGDVDQRLQVSLMLNLLR